MGSGGGNPGRAPLGVAETRKKLQGGTPASKTQAGVLLLPAAERIETGPRKDGDP